MKAYIRNLFLLIAALFAVLGLLSCAGGEEDDSSASSGQAIHDDDDAVDDDDAQDDRPVDADSRAEAAEALVVTTEEMAGAWQLFADWKDRTGLRTDVALIEDILSKDTADDAVALRDFLIDQHSQGIRYALLGGDADQIPYIRGYSEVWAVESYYGTAPIQAFFEEHDKDWDADGDGQWGEQGEDIALMDLREAKISVGRVPVETEDEALGFIEKLIRYESAEGRVRQRAACPLFLADLAASVPIVGEIDGGMTHEQLIELYMPGEFTQNMRRLYGTDLYAGAVGAEVGTSALVRQAFEEEGYAFSVTNSHGGFSDLTLSMNRNLVETLENDVPFVFISTSCLAGNFADEARSNGDNPPQTGTDSVAEEIIKNPDGGAVVYVGNTLVGLGPVGGVQFNHSLCRAIFTEGDTIFGDAMMNARRTFWSETASVKIGEQVISWPLDLFPGTEWYTQRAIILLGDPMLRVWTQTPGELSMDGAATFKIGYNTLEVTVTEDGSPASGVLVSLSQLGGVLIWKKTDSEGKAEFKANLEDGDLVAITAWADQKAPAIVELTQE